MNKDNLPQLVVVDERLYLAKPPKGNQIPRTPVSNKGEKEPQIAENPSPRRLRSNPYRKIIESENLSDSEGDKKSEEGSREANNPPGYPVAARIDGIRRRPIEVAYFIPNLEDDLEELDREEVIAVAEMEAYNFASFKDRVPEFQGEPSELARFINLCSMYYEQLDEPGQRSFYRDLAIKIKGKAYDLYNHGGYADWPAYRVALETNLRGRVTLEGLQTEMGGLTQGKFRTVVEYADKIRSLLSTMTETVHAAHAEAAVRASFRQLHERIAMRTFMEGLMEPLKHRVIARDLDSFEAMVEYALQEEPFSKRAARIETDGGTTRARTGNYTDRFRPTMFRNPPKPNFGNQAIKQERPDCNRCGRMGHTTAACFAHTHSDGRDLRGGDQKYGNQDDRNQPYRGAPNRGPFNQGFNREGRYPNRDYEGDRRRNDPGNQRREEVDRDPKNYAAGGPKIGRVSLTAENQTNA